MCRWIAYSGKEIYPDEFIFSPGNSLVEQSMHAREGKSPLNGDGFGIGWYGERSTPGIYKDILPAWSDENLRNLAHQLKTGMFFAHVRAATGTPTMRQNCHPFSSEKCLFMHNGQISNFANVKRKLLGLLSDEYFRRINGNTDSEIIFQLLLMKGVLKDPSNVFRETTKLLLEIMKEDCSKAVLKLTCCLAEKDRIIAFRYSNKSGKYAPGLYWRYLDKGLLLASEPLDEVSEKWEKAEPGEMVICADNKVKVEKVL